MSRHLMKMTLYPSTLFITMKYVYTKKYHTFGNYVCLQNVYSVHFYVNYKGFRQSKEFTLTHYNMFLVKM